MTVINRRNMIVGSGMVAGTALLGLAPGFVGHRGWFPAFMSVLCYRDDLDMSVALQFNQVPSVPGLYTLANALMDEAAAL